MKKILVVDDEPAIAELLRIFLSTLGIETEVCLDGTNALRAITANDFDVVFCDYTLPDMNGSQLLNEMKKIKPFITEQFVLMTGMIMEDSVNDLIQSEGIRVIYKPFQLEKIKTLLEEIEAEKKS